MKRMSEILTFFKGQGRANTLNMSNLREGFASLTPPWGSVSLTSTASTTVTNSDTWYKAAGTTALNGGYLMTMPENNRLTYIGDSPRHFHCVVTLSMSFDSGTNQVMSLALGKSGTVDEGTVAQRFVSALDIGSTAIHGDFMLENGDYIELFVKSNTTTANITVENQYMFAMGMMV